MKRVLVCLFVLAVLCGSAPVFAQTTGWLDVNIGAAVPAGGDRATTYDWTEYGWDGERASLKVNYKVATGANIDFSGGVMITPLFGIGITRSGTGHITDAPISLTVPHPRYFDAYGTGTSVIKGLEYAEGAWHIQAVGQVPTKNDKVRIRVFGGPSYFTGKGSGVTHITYNQTWILTSQTVDITGTTLNDVSVSAWGFNAGADLAYFFHRVVGLGGVVRYSRASATVTDSAVMANDPLPVKMGGLQVAAGLRLRFGHK